MIGLRLVAVIGLFSGPLGTGFVILTGAGFGSVDDLGAVTGVALGAVIGTVFFTIGSFSTGLGASLVSLVSSLVSEGLFSEEDLIFAAWAFAALISDSFAA